MQREKMKTNLEKEIYAIRKKLSQHTVKDTEKIIFRLMLKKLKQHQSKKEFLGKDINH